MLQGHFSVEDVEKADGFQAFFTQLFQNLSEKNAALGEWGQKQ